MTKTTPPRPRVTDELVLLALETRHADKKDEWNFDDIVQEYCPSKDGYELMRSLERNCYWDGSRDLMDDLDAVDFSVNRIHKQAIKDWVTVYGVTAELQVGDDVMWKSRKAKITNITPDVAQYTIQFYEPYTKRMPMTIGSSSAMYANFEDVAVTDNAKSE